MNSRPLQLHLQFYLMPEQVLLIQACGRRGGTRAGQNQAQENKKKQQIKILFNT